MSNIGPPEAKNSHRRVWRRAGLRSLWPYSATFCGALIILGWVSELWRANWRIPFYYYGDALFYQTVIKGMVENNWYLRNDFLGAPFGTSFYDFPIPDTLNFLVIKLLALLISDAAFILNLFYVLTFPVVACLALFACRTLRLSVPTSMVVALLYAFLPFHFYRNEGHLFWSAYYSVPLVTPLIFRIFHGKMFEADALTRHGRRKKILGALLICWVIASSGWGYYPIFACFFLLLAGAWSAYYHRQVGYVRPAILSSAVIGGFFALNLAPNYVHQLRHGVNKIVVRDPATAEVYGLKVTQMLLPVTGHRLPALAAFKDAYNRHAPLVNENDSAALGVVLGAGFLISLGCLFFRRRAFDPGASDKVPPIFLLGVLNLGGVLLATVGGFGSLGASLIFSQIRSYNRIIVFLAFFSALALGLCLDKIYERLRAKRFGRGLWVAGLAFLLVIGIADQTTDASIPHYEQTRAAYENDRSFVRQIESLAPREALIFQLPYSEFPEPQSQSRVGLYDGFRGYLHSRRARWSYGAIKGRAGDLWLKETSARPTGELMQTLSVAGFSGIYIDRNGYDDRGATVEAHMRESGAQLAIISANERFAFYDLAPVTDRLKTQYRPDELTSLRKRALHPVLAKWGTGFFALERNGEQDWRWCSGEGELRVINPSEKSVRVEVEMILASGYPELSALKISGADFGEEIKINDVGQKYARQWVIPPGGLGVKFINGEQRVVAPSDPRLMVFKVVNFTMRVLD